MGRHVVGCMAPQGEQLTGERSLLCAMALEGNITRRIGNIICGNGRVVGDLLYDERGQPTSVLVGPMPVEKPSDRPRSVIPQ
jgi:hypothetical protein